MENGGGKKPWHRKGISGLGENRLQLLQTKPEEEMFTTLCTLHSSAGASTTT